MVVRPRAVELIDYPTIFEILTAMAILHFAKKKVDLVVCEVGLGGTYDATNVLTPLFSVITNVALDHTEVLGRTLSSIARDKAGIVRPDSILVTGEKKARVMNILKGVCARRNTKLIENQKSKAQSQKLKPKPKNFRDHFQQENLAVVLECVKVLRQKGYKISNQAMQSGVNQTFWPARFQILSRKPQIILDGAHNPAGVRHLVWALKNIGYLRPAALVFGAIKNKDTRQMLKTLLPHFDEVMITDFKYPAALPAQTILRQAKALKNVPRLSHRFSSPLSALRFARRRRDKTIVVCGSLYLAGELLSQLKIKPNKRGQHGRARS
jgi:dihydrofolate synthase/folylpolyglutamate synthase